MVKNEAVLKDRFQNLGVPTRRQPTVPAPAPLTSSPDDSFGSQYLLLNERYPLSQIRLNPLNEVFRAYKTPQHLALLKQDLLEHGLVQPLVVTRDGLLLEGESRFLCLQALVSDGHSNFSSVRVFVHDEDISEQEAFSRLLRSNLTRFEIPQDDRLFLLVSAFPDFAADPDALSRGEIAVLMNVSPDHAKYLKRVAKKALSISKAEGSSVITASSISAAREETNKSRREKASPPEPSPPSPSRPVASPRAPDLAQKPLSSSLLPWPSVESTLSSLSPPPGYSDAERSIFADTVALVISSLRALGVSDAK